MIFEYWMFELLFVSLIYSKLYKIKIYSHQKIGIIFNSLCCLAFGIIRFVILFIKFHQTEFLEDNEKIPYFSIKYAWFIPISIIIYLFIISSTSYIYTYLKIYMDLKFISQVKLLILYGIIGFAFSSITCTIETFSKCIGNEKEFFCKIYEPYDTNPADTNNETNANNQSNDRYIENIIFFIKDFQRINDREKIIEIVIIFIRVLFNFFSLYFDMLVIKYLTPMHFLFGSLIYIFLTDITQLINPKNIDESYLPSITILNILAYNSTFIGFMIYLEIIELNFCKLNYNLRKYINERSINDTYEDSDTESIIDDGDSYERNSSIKNSVELPYKEKK